MANDGPALSTRVLCVVVQALAGAFVAAMSISLTGAAFGRAGTKIAVIVLICAALAIRRRSYAFAVAILVVTPIAAWVMLQGLSPIDGPK